MASAITKVTELFKRVAGRKATAPAPKPAPAKPEPGVKV